MAIDVYGKHLPVLIMAGGLAAIMGSIPMIFVIFKGGNLNEALAMGARIAGWTFLISWPVLALMWRYTHKGADAAGSLFFSAHDGKAAARGFSAERAMARDGRGSEALEALWDHHEKSAGKEAEVLWELIELARRHALKHPLVARSAQRLLRQAGLSELDRRRLQEVLALATADPLLAEDGIS